MSTVYVLTFGHPTGKGRGQGNGITMHPFFKFLGGAESVQHRLRRQTSHRPKVQRLHGAGRHEALALRRRRRGGQAQGPGGVQERAEDLHPGGDQLDGVDEDEGDCGGVPGLHGHRGGHYGARLL